ncbi:MAG: polysaccharide deacetylase family protein [Candidatus Muiribacteriota bacterium]
MKIKITIVIMLIGSLCVFASDFQTNLENYMEYYKTLNYFSDKAFNLEEQNTPEYFEIYYSAHFVKNKLEEVEVPIFEEIENNPVETLRTFKNSLQKRSGGFHQTIFKEMINKNIEILLDKGEVEVINEMSDFMLNLNSTFRSELNLIFSPSEKVLNEINENFAVENYETETTRGERNNYSSFFSIVMTGTNKNVPFLSQKDNFLKPGEILITFDDGPTNIGDRTLDVTNTMINYNYPGIFFVLGSKIGNSTRHLIEKQAKICDVSIHGWNHFASDGNPFTAMSLNQALSDIGRTYNSIRGITGKNPGFFRAPYGIVTTSGVNRIVNEYNLVPLGWTIDSLDWSTKDPDELFNKMTQMISKRGKGILLMHDIHEQSRVSFIRLADWLKKNGYTIVNPDVLTKAFFGNNHVSNPVPVDNSNPNIRSIIVSKANVRTGPGTDNSILGAFDYGTQVEILEKVSDWYKIKIISTGQIGYIFGDLIN